jgi:Ca2+-binding EF-hand superfamily protein
VLETLPRLLTPAERQSVAAQFAAADLDKSGFLTEGELWHLLRKTEGKAAAAEPAAAAAAAASAAASSNASSWAMERLDVSGDGRVSLEEFTAALLFEDVTDDVGSLLLLFSECDDDGLGVLDIQTARRLWEEAVVVGTDQRSSDVTVGLVEPLRDGIPDSSLELGKACTFDALVSSCDPGVADMEGGTVDYESLIVQLFRRGALSSLRLRRDPGAAALYSAVST